MYVLLSLLRPVLWPDIWSIPEIVSCALKYVYFVVVGWSVLPMCVRSNLCVVLFKYLVFLLIFCIVVLSMIESGVFKYLIIAKLCISSFNSLIFLLHMLWGSVVRCIYISNCYSFLMGWHFYHYKMSLFISSAFFVLKSVLSDISIATVVFFCLLFAWRIFSHTFTFNIFLSLNLKCVFCRQHIQVVPDLQWFNLRLFNFMMVWWWYEFSRNHTLNFDLFLS